MELELSELQRSRRVSLAVLLRVIAHQWKRRFAMWITLFTVVIGIALCLAVGAMALSYDKKVR